jgi:hypothetical protein
MRQLKLAAVECRPECHSLRKEEVDLCNNNNSNPTVHRWAATSTSRTANVKESVNASATTLLLPLRQPPKPRPNVMTNKVNKTPRKKLGKIFSLSLQSPPLSRDKNVYF